MLISSILNNKERRLYQTKYIFYIYNGNSIFNLPVNVVDIALQDRLQYDN